MSATLAKDSAEAAAAKAAAARAAANMNGAVVQRRAPTQDDAAVRRAALTAKVAQALKQVRLLPLARVSPPCVSCQDDWAFLDPG